MSYKEIQSLDAEVTTALGGVNKATGKQNPKQAEGYYLGSRKVESKKAKSGFAQIHYLQTSKGNLGIWGKTDLDRKMGSVPVGAMTKITQDGMVPTPNGEMYKYRVAVDKENTIEVETANANAQEQGEEEGSGYGSYGDNEDGEEEAALDEAPSARAAAPKAPTQVNKGSVDRTRALLGGVRKTA